MEDPIYFGLFAAIALELRATRGTRAEWVVVRSINGAIGVGPKAAFWRSRVIGGLMSYQWIRAARPWIKQVAYRSLSFGHPVADFAIEHAAVPCGAPSAARAKGFWP